MHFHHPLWSIFCRKMSSVFPASPVSRVQKLSSVLTVLCKAACVAHTEKCSAIKWRHGMLQRTSTSGGCPTRPNLMCPALMTQSTCFPRVPGGTGTLIVTSCSVCVHVYLSVMPPFPWAPVTRQQGEAGMHREERTPRTWIEAPLIIITVPIP